MRMANIFYSDLLAGKLIETDDGEYTFGYDADYIKKYSNQFVTFAMPVTKGKYKANRLFPFFEGLIPEGWLLYIASKNWKINKNDRMGLLLAWQLEKWLTQKVFFKLDYDRYCINFRRCICCRFPTMRQVFANQHKVVFGVIVYTVSQISFASPFYNIGQLYFGMEMIGRRELFLGKFSYRKRLEILMLDRFEFCFHINGKYFPKLVLPTIKLAIFAIISTKYPFF